VLGGDFFDVAAIDNKHIGMVMADVSGHGVAASLVVVVLKTLLLNAAAYVKTPAKFMENVNEQLLKVIPETYYLTCFYGILNTKNGQLNYTSCGHPPPFLLRKKGGCERLECKGFFLGLDPRLELEQKSEVLSPGDQVILYTDGVTDNRINEHVQYGEERLRQSILLHAGQSASQLLDGLVQDFHHHTGNRTPDDDVALMCVEYCRKKMPKAKKPVTEDAIAKRESTAVGDLLH
jgi:sigma-B regulation protein RsbU (phosphoserine phosphatase)